MQVPVIGGHIFCCLPYLSIFTGFKSCGQSSLFGVFQADSVIRHGCALVNGLHIESQGVDEARCATGCINLIRSIEILLTEVFPVRPVGRCRGVSICGGAVSKFHYQQTCFHHVDGKHIGFVVGRVFVPGHHNFTIELGFTDNGGGPGHAEIKCFLRLDGGSGYAAEFHATNLHEFDGVV